MARVEWFDDLTVGMRFKSPEVEVTEADIKRFAAEFDPQPMHLDEEAASRSMLQGLSGSGWHLCSIMMRMMVDGFVVRYDTRSGKDGLPPGEGAFLACSFWFVDNLTLLGRISEAERLFERLCRLCNDVGLLSEEYDPHAKRLVGNFPQAFSHIAMVNSAHNLVLSDNSLKQRAGHHSQSGSVAPSPEDSSPRPSRKAVRTRD